MTAKIKTVILISADAEWQAVKGLFPTAEYGITPYGEWFNWLIGAETLPVMQAGWGKSASGGAAQYAIDRWQPEILVNLGTCGGFAGRVERGEVILAERTVIYDIVEMMGDVVDCIAERSVDLNISWLKKPLPFEVRRSILVSGDRDIQPGEIPELVEKYGAVAADWESGTLAWVCARNGVKCLILRGVSDLVGEAGGEAYGDYGLFVEKTREVMKGLFEEFGEWVQGGGLADKVITE
jgi:adenosylhomocysteine nucleosidase